MRRHRRWAGLVATTVLGTAAWLVPATPAHAAGTLTVDKTSADYEEQRVGLPDGTARFTVTASGEAVTIEDITAVSGNGIFDYLALVFDPDVTYCYDSDGDDTDDDVTLDPGESCVLDMGFFPFREGDRNLTIGFDSNAGNNPTIALSGTGTTGYYIVGTLGQVAAFGDASDFGDASELDLNSPMVGMATVPDGDGYWLAARDGGIFAFNAPFHGSMGGTRLNQPIVGIAGLPDPFFEGLEGYYEVAADGGIFAFGDAEFHGSTGGIRLNQPIVGMAMHPSGNGYWLVASDGGVFAFGDAEFHGSMGGTRLNQPVVGMAATPTGEGYWLVARDGGIFAFGDAEFHGSTGGIRLNQPIVGMAPTPLGNGYWLVAEDGGIFAFDATFHGSLPSSGITGVNDVIGIAPTAPPTAIGQFALAGSRTLVPVRAPRGFGRPSN